MTDPTRSTPARAWIVLPGHRDAAAEIVVAEQTLSARLLRTAARAAGWTAATGATFFVTMFDPFLTSIPLLVGAVSVWKSLHGRYRVHHFRGACPRCGEAMKLDPGARIAAAHRMVCYHCHHEPELLVAA